MANIQLMQPARLPKAQPLDLVTPLKMYYAGQQSKRRDMLADRQIKMQDMKMAEYQAGAPLREQQSRIQGMKMDEYEAGAGQREDDARFEAITKKLSRDKAYMAIAQESIMSIDPDAEDFDQQVSNSFIKSSNYLRSIGVPVEDIADLNERGILNLDENGIARGITPDYVRSLQGHYKAQSAKGKEYQDKQNMPGFNPDTEIINGMQYTLDASGNYIRSEIKGDPIPEEPKNAVSQTGKIQQDMSNLDKNDPDYEKKKAELQAGIRKSIFDPQSKMYDDRKVADESKLRKEFQGISEVKDYPLIESQKMRLDKAMEEAKTSNSLIAVDQALITILNKMLDPTSVVRESEYARTPADQSLISRIKGKLGKLNTGGAGLTKDERNAIYRMSGLFHDVAKEQYDNQVEYYTDLTLRYKYDPQNVIRLGGGKKSSGKAVERPNGTFMEGENPDTGLMEYYDKDGNKI